jgi:hypothetical protein
MRFRKLRIAWSVACGILCVLLIVLWVRSYQACEIVFKLDASNRVTTFGSNSGTIYFVSMDQPTMGRYGPQPTPDGWKLASAEATEVPRIIEWEFSSGKDFVRVPHWLLVVSCLAIGFVPWIRRRYSLRTLLIAITLISFLLGLTIWILRSE